METSAELPLKDRHRLGAFFDRLGMGVSLSDDPSKRPAERIAVALRKTYIVTMVVSMAGYAGLVHNRMTNDAYQDADFEEAMVDANAQITMLVTRAKAGGGLSLGLVEDEAQNPLEPVSGPGSLSSRSSGASVHDWFTENNIDGRAISRILDAHATEGSQARDAPAHTDIDTLEHLPTPIEIKTLIQQAQAEAGVALQTAADAVEEGLSVHIWAVSMCDRSPTTPCRVTVVPVGADSDEVLVMDAQSGDLEVAPGMSDLEDDSTVSQRLPSALR